MRDLSSQALGRAASASRPLLDGCAPFQLRARRGTIYLGELARLPFSATISRVFFASQPSLSSTFLRGERSSQTCRKCLGFYG